jgi:hypothetical protein
MQHGIAIPVGEENAVALGAETFVEGDSGNPEEAPPPLHRIVEALLFVGGAPLSAERACETIRGLTPGQFRQALDALNRDYRQ